jgi:hypothetical protein
MSCCFLYKPIKALELLKIEGPEESDEFVKESQVEKIDESVSKPLYLGPPLFPQNYHLQN